MSSKAKPEVVRFRRVARQRRDEARFLLANDYTNASTYLAGYAVECMLKALILKNTPVKFHKAVVESFRGKGGHNFETLKHLLTQRGVVFPKVISAALGRVAHWTTDLRYEPRKLRYTEADDFMKATEQIVRWAEGRL